MLPVTANSRTSASHAVVIVTAGLVLGTVMADCASRSFVPAPTAFAIYSFWAGLSTLGPPYLLTTNRAKKWQWGEILWLFHGTIWILMFSMLQVRWWPICMVGAGVHGACSALAWLLCYFVDSRQTIRWSHWVGITLSLVQGLALLLFIEMV